MDLPVITMEPEDAMRAFEAYRREVDLRRGEDHYKRQARISRLTITDREALELRESEDEALLAGYRLIMQGKPVISLTQAMADAGRDTTGYPRLGIARADMDIIECSLRDDMAVFAPYRADWGRPRLRAASRRFEVRLPHMEGRPNAWSMIADVPRVPAWLRPRGDLSRYATLFEAVWRQPRQQRRAGDPALLRPLGGDLYAVVAVWDLTPLERAVLGILEPEAVS